MNRHFPLLLLSWCCAAPDLQRVPRASEETRDNVNCTIETKTFSHRCSSLRIKASKDVKLERVDSVFEELDGDGRANWM